MTDLHTLPITGRTRNCLLRGGICTIAALEATTTGRLSAIHGIGPQSLVELGRITPPLPPPARGWKPRRMRRSISRYLRGAPDA